jgi:hypothetical protein
MGAGKQSFPCGHKGRGQYCHRCRADEREAVERAEADAAAAARHKEERDAWQDSHAADPIDLRPLQTRERIEKARALLRRLAAGEPYAQLGGKRWESDRSIVAVPVGRGFRLILRDDGGRLRPLACMTHEAYNNLRPDALAR